MGLAGCAPCPSSERGEDSSVSVQSAIGILNVDRFCPPFSLAFGFEDRPRPREGTE